MVDMLTRTCPVECNTLPDADSHARRLGATHIVCVCMDGSVTIYNANRTEWGILSGMKLFADYMRLSVDTG